MNNEIKRYKKELLKLKEKQKKYDYAKLIPILIIGIPIIVALFAAIEFHLNIAEALTVFVVAAFIVMQISYAFNFEKDIPTIEKESKKNINNSNYDNDFVFKHDDYSSEHFESQNFTFDSSYEDDRYGVNPFRIGGKWWQD
ncbi:hypothetical protein V4D30_01055 [Thermodesulfovibrio sp. 3907-1M]|uniref:Uncharacterized protein n=1 Tax=Thermodesulfovibrio autotrophicus TaxID=3118333 RepID=A0AAU8GY02_9BACT